MEQYETTTFRLQQLHICAWGWYVTTTYHLYTNKDNNVIHMYEFFILEFLVCWRQAWDVLRFRERLSTSLADVLRHIAHDFGIFYDFSKIIILMNDATILGMREWSFRHSKCTLRYVAYLCQHPNWRTSSSPIYPCQPEKVLLLPSIGIALMITHSKPHSL